MIDQSQSCNNEMILISFTEHVVNPKINALGKWVTKAPPDCQF